MRERFQDLNFQAKTLKTIEQANSIIRAYQAQGFTLTLRQLYYQFVSRDLIANKQSEYKRLGSIINDGRLAGLIDWNAIEDRTRNLEKLAAWSSPESIMAAVAAQYREDLWATQPRYVEVWIEKDALVGVIEGVCEEWRVPYFSCRGYVSQSEQYTAGRRFAEARRGGRSPLVLDFHDHDPSGWDMTRDNRDRLAMFARMGVEVRRLALTYEQVEEYSPPPNPTKESDSRTGVPDEYGDYPEGTYGRMMQDQEADPDTCWELDALEPAVIAALIRDEIEREVDQEAWDAAQAEEDTHKRTLAAISERWDDVQDFLGDDAEEDDE